MSSTLAVLLGCLCVAYVVFFTLLRVTQGQQEPPPIETAIPFISPLFGLTHGMPKFLNKLR
jgi:hypothetical protein